MQLKTIQVAIYGCSHKIRQWALVDDDDIFAIHPAINSPRWTEFWAVTHIPSGAAVGITKRNGIYKALEEARTLRFAGRPLKEHRTCDIIMFHNEIRIENGKSSMPNFDLSELAAINVC